MEFKLNEDQQLMKDMFVEFTEQFVKPIAAELDEQELLPGRTDSTAWRNRTSRNPGR